jgi:flagellin-like hook-associated protein FlgL
VTPKSRRDGDFVKAQILQQASVAVLVQAHASPQSVRALLS